MSFRLTSMACAFRSCTLSTAVLAVALLAVSAGLRAQAPAPTADAFYTLGTGSGPTPQARRAQPANLLMAGEQGILVDVGDGATQQLGKIGVPLTAIQTVFISHLHFDHTGGLFAFLSRRYQLLVPGQVTIYGPPGTRATVDGMLAAMAPAVTATSNIRKRSNVSPEDTVKVVEIHDGWTGRIGDVRVTAASNSHYVLQPDTPDGSKNHTYALRFDLPRRSIVYTGDTGPSAAVERLAKDADILFSEIIDADAALANIRRTRPDVAASALVAVEAHYRNQHLSASEAGLLARRAQVKTLVLTHNAIADDALPQARAIIAREFGGSISFAEDLERF